MNIVFIGAGNLAVNLAHALNEQGFVIKQIFSRTEQSAQMLAESVDADYTTNTGEILAGEDLYFVALKDDVIEEVLPKVKINNGLLVHTAGSVPMEILASYSKNYGVFYPLQTFSKYRLVNFQNIPLCLEANSSGNLKVLQEIAGKLSDNVHNLSSEQRLQLHVAAVYACNFTNFMFVGAEHILSDKNISFHLLVPLIKETVEKIESESPAKAQTGPAVRNDKKTLDKHLKLLSGSWLFQNLYRFVSDSIIQYFKNNKRDT